MAGRVAELLVLGQASSGAGLGPGSDLDQATAVALAIETEHGLGGRDLAHAPVPRGDRHRMPAELRARVEAHLRVAEGRARTILHDRRAVLDAVTEALMSERELDAAQIAGLVAPPGATSAPSLLERDASSDVAPSRRTADHAEARAAPPSLTIG